VLVYSTNPLSVIDIAQLFPKLTFLDHTQFTPDNDTYDTQLTTRHLITSLNLCLDLEILLLPPFSSLGMGYDPPHCGIGYSNLSSQQRLELDETLKSVKSKIIEWVVELQHPSLREVWAGDFDCLEVTMPQEGEVKARWLSNRNYALGAPRMVFGR
jgi:hypothetical protein